MKPAPDGTLAGLLLDPARAASLTREQTTGILVELVSLQATLLARLGAAAPAAPAVREEPGRLLTASEAAERLGVSLRWIYRNKARLPFLVQLSRKVLRASEPELRRYLQQKRR